MQIRVSDVIAKGTLRFTARPLLDELPVVGAVKASFVKAPTFSYSVVAYGVNPMFLPGLERFINTFIKQSVLRPLVFPSVRSSLTSWDRPGVPPGRPLINPASAAGFCGASDRPPPRRDRGA